MPSMPSMLRWRPRKREMFAKHCIRIQRPPVLCVPCLRSGGTTPSCLKRIFTTRAMSKLRKGVDTSGELIVGIGRSLIPPCRRRLASNCPSISSSLPQCVVSGHGYGFIFTTGPRGWWRDTWLCRSQACYRAKENAKKSSYHTERRQIEKDLSKEVRFFRQLKRRNP
jgi:hypothetical protein